MVQRKELGCFDMMFWALFAIIFGVYFGVMISTAIWLSHLLRVNSAFLALPLPMAPVFVLLRVKKWAVPWHLLIPLAVAALFVLRSGPHPHLRATAVYAAHVAAGTLFAWIIVTAIVGSVVHRGNRG